jgi:hypothetical protein
MDEKGQITSFINAFTIVDDYRGEPLKIRFFQGNTEMDDWIYTFFESLIIPHIRYTNRLHRLSLSDIALIKCIHLLKNQGKEITLSAIGKYYNSRKAKTIHLSSIQKNLKRLELRLRELLQLDNFLDVSNDQSSKEYLRRFKNDIYQLIDFCDQSGFINLWCRTAIMSANKSLIAKSAAGT